MSTSNTMFRRDGEGGIQVNSDRYLQCYLTLDGDWPLSLVSIHAQQRDPMFTSIQLFDIYFPDKSRAEFIEWRSHRLFSNWQDDIYSMSDEVFQFHWPMIAGALAELDASS